MPDFRIRLIFYAVAGLSLVLVFRLFNLQVLENSEFVQLAQNQQSVWATTSGTRGSILASDGFPLALSSPGWVVTANPKKIKDTASTARLLAPLFIQQDRVKPGVENSGENSPEEDEKSKDQLLVEEGERLRKLLTRGGEWVALKEGVRSEVKDNIAAFLIEGLG